MSDISIEEVRRVRERGRLLFAQAEIEASIKRMARELETYIKDQVPVLLSVMNGGLMTTGELLKYLQC